MKPNGKEIAIQNNPTIREIRRQLKDKFSEMEEVVFDNLEKIKAARVESLEQELAIKKDVVDHLRSEKAHLLSQNFQLTQKLLKLEKENERLNNLLGTRKYNLPGLF